MNTGDNLFDRGGKRAFFHELGMKQVDVGTFRTSQVQFVILKRIKSSTDRINGKIFTHQSLLKPYNDYQSAVVKKDGGVSILKIVLFAN
jgi:hypothetical protein